MLSTSVRVDKVDDVPDKTVQGVRTGLERPASKGFTVSQQEAPKETGFLAQSGHPPAWVNGRIVWGYGASYAVPVEEGARPHWPPIDPLKGWARRVLGDESAAYAVQAHIAQEGTPAQPYVEPGFEVMVRELRKHGLAPFIDAELGGGVR